MIFELDPFNIALMLFDLIVLALTLLAIMLLTLKFSNLILLALQLFDQNADCLNSFLPNHIRPNTIGFIAFLNL